MFLPMIQHRCVQTEFLIHKFSKCGRIAILSGVALLSNRRRYNLFMLIAHHVHMCDFVARKDEASSVGIAVKPSTLQLYVSMRL